LEERSVGSLKAYLLNLVENDKNYRHPLRKTIQQTVHLLVSPPLQSSIDVTRRHEGSPGVGQGTSLTFLYGSITALANWTIWDCSLSTESRISGSPSPYFEPWPDSANDRLMVLKELLNATPFSMLIAIAVVP
jgi:hypothetical protein